MKLRKIQLDNITWKVVVFNEDANYLIGEMVATLNTESISNIDFSYNPKSDSETLLHRLDNSLDDIYKWLNDPTRASDLRI